MRCRQRGSRTWCGANEIEMTWRRLDTGEGDAAYNMAVDEALLCELLRGNSPPTIRTYRWNPPSFSTGYFQKMSQQVDYVKCKAHGIDRVRRLTGGRTVLHGWDLTYSVVASIDHIAPGGVITDAYREISLALVAGLNRMGVKAEYARPQPREPGGMTQVKTKAKAVKPCFSSISRFEISCGGKKIVGSAQRVVGRHFLQHGSIPLCETPVGPHIFIPRIENQKLLLMDEALKERSTNLSAILGREVGYEEVRDAILSGFEEALGVTIIPGRISEKERLRIEELEKKKYKTTEWNEDGTTGHYDN